MQVMEEVMVEDEDVIEVMQDTYPFSPMIDNPTLVIQEEERKVQKKKSKVRRFLDFVSRKKPQKEEI